MKTLTWLILASFTLANCASTTTIRSTDPEAKIYVDGRYEGKGTAVHTDAKTSFSTTVVRMEKPGCREENFTFSRGQELQVGPLIGGILVLVPLLWVTGYRAENTFEFECRKP